MSLAERIGVADVLWCLLRTMLEQGQVDLRVHHLLAAIMFVGVATHDVHCTTTTLENTHENVEPVVALCLLMLRSVQRSIPRLRPLQLRGLAPLESTLYGRTCQRRFSNFRRLFL